MQNYFYKPTSIFHIVNATLLNGKITEKYFFGQEFAKKQLRLITKFVDILKLQQIIVKDFRNCPRMKEMWIKRLFYKVARNAILTFQIHSGHMHIKITTITQFSTVKHKA